MPVYVDNQLVGYSPLKNPIDVLPGWHKVGYFPNNSTEDSGRLSPKDKMVNDILIMGRLDVFVEEGKHETIVLNYQSLEEDVIDYNKRFQTGTWTGFSLFFLMILLMRAGSSLSNKIIIILLFSFIPTIILTNEESSNGIDSQFSYYRYWNPYKRILDFKGDKASFIGDTFYKVSFNKEKRIKTVTTIDKDNRKEKLIIFYGQNPGLRSEYKVKFHARGNASQLDEFLFSDQLSLVRTGWIADVKSRNDGEPKAIAFRDHLDFIYFYYNFNYTRYKGDSFSAEVIESSYFDSDKNFVRKAFNFLGKWY